MTTVIRMILYALLIYMTSIKGDWWIAGAFFLLVVQVELLLYLVTKLELETAALSEKVQQATQAGWGKVLMQRDEDEHL